MNPTRGYDDFFGLLADQEGRPPCCWERNNLFSALSYRPREEIPAGLDALAAVMRKPRSVVAREFAAFSAETARQRREALKR